MLWRKSVRTWKRAALMLTCPPSPPPWLCPWWSPPRCWWPPPPCDRREIRKWSLKNDAASTAPLFSQFISFTWPLSIHLLLHLHLLFIQLPHLHHLFFLLPLFSSSQFFPKWHHLLLLSLWRFLNKRKPVVTKTDEFSEKYQTAFHPPHFRKMYTLYTNPMIPQS